MNIPISLVCWNIGFGDHLTFCEYPRRRSVINPLLRGSRACLLKPTCEQTLVGWRSPCAFPILTFYIFKLHGQGFHQMGIESFLHFTFSPSTVTTSSLSQESWPPFFPIVCFSQLAPIFITHHLGRLPFYVFFLCMLTMSTWHTNRNSNSNKLSWTLSTLAAEKKELFVGREVGEARSRYKWRERVTDNHV